MLERAFKPIDRALQWWLRRALGGVVLVIAGGMIGLGGYSLRLQQWRMAEAVPVRVRIISSEVGSHYDMHGITTYSPKVRFAYAVNHRGYIGENCLPADDNGTSHWAKGIVGRFPPDTYHIGYYRRTNPGDAFLVRRYAFMPYGFVLFGVLMVGAAVALVMGFLHERQPRAPTFEHGWYALRPSISRGAALKWEAAASLTMLAVGAAVVTHYFQLARGDAEWLSFVGAVIYFLVGMGLPAASLWKLRSAPRLAPPRVLIGSPALTVGETAKVRIEYECDGDFDISGIEASLVQHTFDLVGGKHLEVKRQSRTLASSRLEAAQLQRLGRQVAGVVTLSAPYGAPTSSTRSYPVTRWSVSVSVRSSNGADAIGEFPIRMLPARAIGIPVSR